MNEVEKMYRNCNIKKYRLLDRDNKLKWVYPPFTAEKQLELIKWLIVHSFHICLEDELIVSAFEDSLANLINNLWQYLTEEERKQIKNILE